MVTAAAPATRPTTTVTLGGIDYTAECPKVVFWNDLEGKAVALTEAEQAGDQQAAFAHLTAIADAFMAEALWESWDEIDARMRSRQETLDLPDVRKAFPQLVAEFRPWVVEQGRSIGASWVQLFKVIQDEHTDDAPEQDAPRKAVARRAGSRPTARRR